MKPFRHLEKALAIIGIAAFSCLVSCTKDSVERTTRYRVYDPVYVKKDDIRNGFRTEGPQAIHETGNIWMYGSYLLVSEPKKGLHIIDNANPSAPVPVAFLNIPGNMDMAVKNNILYADSYMDLLVINISNPSQPQLVKRTEDVFPFYIANQDNSIITDYIEREVVEVQEGDLSELRGRGDRNRVFMELGVANDQLAQNAGGGGGGSAPSVGGSMARFALYKDYLYMVTPSSLHTYSLANPVNPTDMGTAYTGGVETVFATQDKLFLGTTSGMEIYSLANPSSPTHISRFSHAFACDPVYVSDKYAYVTLRTGTRCTRASNQLDVIDISNISSPTLVKTYPMVNPHGLGVDGDNLFLCDGSAGLKVYDVAKKDDIQKLNEYTGMETYDVIPYNNLLIMSAKDGIYQYDYSNPSSLKLLSRMVKN